MKKILLLVLALIPVLTFAQGFQVNLEGQKQIGMGHTGTGLVQDGASVFFNPGAVVLLPENYIQAGLSPLLFKSDFNPSGTNAQYQSLNKVATPFNFYGFINLEHAFYWLALCALYRLVFGLIV